MRGWLQGVVLFLFVPTTGGLLITKAQTKADSSATDKAAIRKIISDGTAAWVFYGRKGFKERHAQIFSTIVKGRTFQQTIRKIRFVRQGVAVVDVDTEMTGYTRLPPEMQAGCVP